MSSNLLNSVQNQILRGRVLKICYQAEPLGAGTEIISHALRKEGYVIDSDGALNICKYLEGKKLVRVERVENKILDIGRDIAHILPSGIDLLEGTIKVEGVEL